MNIHVRIVPDDPKKPVVVWTLTNDYPARTPAGAERWYGVNNSSRDVLRGDTLEGIFVRLANTIRE